MARLLTNGIRTVRAGRNVRQVGRVRRGRRAVVGWDECSRRPARAGPEDQARAHPPAAQPGRAPRRHECWDARRQPPKVWPRDAEVGRLREWSCLVRGPVGRAGRRYAYWLPRPAAIADSAGSGVRVRTAPIRRPTPAPRRGAHPQRDGSSFVSCPGGSPLSTDRLTAAFAGGRNLTPSP